MCMTISLHVCGGQKRVFDPLELELRTVVSECWVPKQSPLQERMLFPVASFLSGPSSALWASLDRWLIPKA